MAKRKKRKATAWNRTFGTIAKTCFKHAQTMSAYGTCMKSELKAASGKRKRSKKR
jgi:hypothetical protein